MSSRSYKLIFVLLSCCILFILALQGYWIRNFYLQKKEAFNSTVYETLGQLTTKLQERKSLQSLKMTYFIQNGDTIAKTPSRKMTVVSASNVQIINENSSVTTKRVLSLKNKATKGIKDSILINGKEDHIQINLEGSQSRVIVNNKKSLKDLVKKNAKDLINEEELVKLVDKMVTEIKVIDVETEDPDSLQALIKRSLANKGLFLSFEFSMQNLQGKEKKVLAQSKGFLNENGSYKSDLSVGKIIPTGEFLFLQFPGQYDFVIAGMRGSLILSLVFSLLIISVFYYVIRIILNQKKLSEIKNDFVNNMTHELKTPIATISLALDGLNNPLVKNDEDKFNRYTRILKEENQKLNRHVERVLQIALLDKGELRLNKKPADLSELIHSAIKGYALQIAEQKAEVRFKDPSEKISVNADGEHLKTVFGNLLDNALKYSKDICVIEITLEQRGKEVRLYFKDNGIGIDANKQEKIFDKFYRVQGGNLHDVKGFGLGLSYVKAMAEAHGGRVEVKSEPGKGSEFVVYLKAM